MFYDWLMLCAVQIIIFLTLCRLNDLHVFWALVKLGFVKCLPNGEHCKRVEVRP